MHVARARQPCQFDLRHMHGPKNQAREVVVESKTHGVALLLLLEGDSRGDNVICHERQWYGRKFQLDNTACTRHDHSHRQNATKNFTCDAAITKKRYQTLQETILSQSFLISSSCFSVQLTFGQNWFQCHCLTCNHTWCQARGGSKCGVHGGPRFSQLSPTQRTSMEKPVTSIILPLNLHVDTLHNKLSVRPPTPLHSRMHMTY